MVKIYGATANPPRNTPGNIQTRVNIDQLVNELISLKLNTYFYWLGHNVNDWTDPNEGLFDKSLVDRNGKKIELWNRSPNLNGGLGDAQEFIRKTAGKGINTFLVLYGLGQNPKKRGNKHDWTQPYGDDYVKWFEEAAKYSLQYPNLQGIVIDDFTGRRNRAVDSNNPGVDPEIVKEMVLAAKTINPDFKFYPIVYCDESGLEEEGQHYTDFKGKYFGEEGNRAPSFNHIDGIILFHWYYARRVFDNNGEKVRKKVHEKIDLKEADELIRATYLKATNEMGELGKDLIFGAYIDKGNIDETKNNINHALTYPVTGAMFYSLPYKIGNDFHWPIGETHLDQTREHLLSIE